jgi:hypothetical protein
MPNVAILELFQLVELARLEEVEAAWRRAGLPQVALSPGTVSPSGAWFAETQPISLSIESVPSDFVWSVSAPSPPSGADSSVLVTEMRAHPPAGADEKTWISALRTQATRAVGEPAASLAAAGAQAWSFCRQRLEAQLVEASASDPAVLRVRRRPLFRR